MNPLDPRAHVARSSALVPPERPGDEEDRHLEVLARTGDRSMADQRLAIEEAFASYQAEEERRDDVTIVGFRI